MSRNWTIPTRQKRGNYVWYNNLLKNRTHLRAFWAACQGRSFVPGILPHLNLVLICNKFILRFAFFVLYFVFCILYFVFCILYSVFWVCMLNIVFVVSNNMLHLNLILISNKTLSTLPKSLGIFYFANPVRDCVTYVYVVWAWCPGHLKAETESVV